MSTYLVYLIPVVLLIIIGSLLGWREARQFKEQWPPIDDEEFLRRCEPGTSQEIALKVRSIFSTCLGVPYEQIYPEQTFEDLGAG